MADTALVLALAALVSRSTDGMASCTYTSCFPGLSREYSNTNVLPARAGWQVSSSKVSDRAVSILSPSFCCTWPAIGRIVRTHGVDPRLSQQSQQHARTTR